MTKGYHFTVKGNRIKVSGVSFGYGDSDPYLIAQEEDLFLVRKPATRDWAQLGSSGGFPAYWTLFCAAKDPNHFDEMIVTEILAQREPGRKWKKTKDELLSMMKNAAAKPKE